MSETRSTVTERTQQGGIILRKVEDAGDAVKFLRGIERWSQRLLAARAGFRQAQIHTWETHERSPSVESLIRLGDALGCDLMLVPRP